MKNTFKILMAVLLALLLLFAICACSVEGNEGETTGSDNTTTTDSTQDPDQATTNPDEQTTNDPDEQTTKEPEEQTTEPEDPIDAASLLAKAEKLFLAQTVIEEKMQTEYLYKEAGYSFSNQTVENYIYSGSDLQYSSVEYDDQQNEIEQKMLIIGQTLYVKYGDQQYLIKLDEHSKALLLEQFENNDDLFLAMDLRDASVEVKNDGYVISLPHMISSLLGSEPTLEDTTIDYEKSSVLLQLDKDCNLLSVTATVSLSSVLETDFNYQMTVTSDFSYGKEALVAPADPSSWQEASFEDVFGYDPAIVPLAKDAAALLLPTEYTEGYIDADLPIFADQIRLLGDYVDNFCSCIVGIRGTVLKEGDDWYLCNADKTQRLLLFFDDEMTGIPESGEQIKANAMLFVSYNYDEDDNLEETACVIVYEMDTSDDLVFTIQAEEPLTLTYPTPLYMAPDTRAVAVNYLRSGTVLSCVGQAGDWYHVLVEITNADGTTEKVDRYVYLGTDSSAGTDDPTVNDGPVVYILASSLWVRSEPVFSGDENKLGLVHNGDVVRVIEKGTNYYKIYYTNENGETLQAYISNSPKWVSETAPE